MDSLTHLKTLKPLAEAIVYLADNAEEVDQIEAKLHSLQSDLEKGEARLKEISDQVKQHTEMSETAKASVIEARSKLNQMVEGAKAEAQRITTQAMTEANDIAQRERVKFAAEEIKLRAGIEALQNEKELLATEVAARRRDHDAVVASMDSLKKRLEGRAA